MATDHSERPDREASGVVGAGTDGVTPQTNKEHRFDTVPNELQEREQWLMWDSAADTPRRPHWQGDFYGISWSDPEDWHSFESAVAAATEKDSWGIGYVNAADNDNYEGGRYMTIDIDGGVDEAERPKDWLPSLGPFIERDAYIEWSPSKDESGNSGLHIPVKNYEPPDWWTDTHLSDNEHEGVEVLTNKFSTVTGNKTEFSGSDVVEGGDWLNDWLREATKALTGEDPDGDGDENQPCEEFLKEDDIRDALEHIDPDTNYPLWRDIGFALVEFFDSKATAKSVFKEWSRDGSKWDDDAEEYADRIIDDATSTGGRTIGTVIYHAQQNEWELPTPSADMAPQAPAEHVESELIDTLLADPDAWIDADTKTWTVRATDDHDADEIADAIRDGELPGDADAALGDAVLKGEIPETVAEALQSWRSAPQQWTVTVVRSFDEGALKPAAIAAAAGVDPDDLGDLPARERAHHVWERVQRRDDYQIIARMGEWADGALFSYDHDAGVWRETGANDLRTLGSEVLGPAYSKRVGSELEERVRVTAAPGEPIGHVHIDEFGPPPETVPVANGLLDLADRDLRPLEPTDYALATLPVEFDNAADCPTFEDYLTDVCPRPVDRKKFQEYIGYTLLHWALPYHKALFIAGPQASGKSTFLDVVHALLGDETTCSLAPQEFTSERFAGYDLWGAWANIRSDIPADLIENTGKFKEVTAGDPVKVERKYEDPVTIEPTAKHLFAANTLPTADIDDDAFFRRILLVSFPNTIPRSERDPNLFDTLTDELPGVLNWALDGLNRLRDQGHFSGDLPPAETKGKWRIWGESIERFVEQCIDEDASSTAFTPKGEVIDAYKRFCEANGIPAKTSQKFGREVKNIHGFGEGQRTVDGNRVEVYTGIELHSDRIPAIDSAADGGVNHGMDAF